MRMKKRALVAVLPVLLLAGCAAAEPAAEPVPSSAAPTVSLERCLEVDQSTIDAISAGVDEGISLSGWSAVRSDDYAQVWFVSAIATGGVFESDVFTFATNGDPTRADDSGMVLAADGFSDEFSDWPYGPDTDFGIQFVDDGGEESGVCAEAAASAD